MRSDSSACTSASESEDEGELNSEDSGSSSSTSSEGITTEEGEVDSDVDENDLEGGRVSPKVETPWERGLRLARERLLKAKLRRQTEADLEEKKLKLTVTAPETTEEDQLAAGEIGASRVTDVFWLNYYKLAMVGCTQLTGKRSLPCDIAVPSSAKLAYWRRHHGGCTSQQRPHHRHQQQSEFVRTRVRSGSQSSASSSTADSLKGRSRTSSLSSLAGSIFLAVPELAADDESDRDAHQRRRRRRRHSSGSSASSSPGADSASALSPSTRRAVGRNQRSGGGGRRYGQVDASPSNMADSAASERTRRRRRYGGSSRSRSSSSASGSSSSSSSSSRPTAGAAAYSRERSRSPKRRPPAGPPHKPFANTNQIPTNASNIWRGRRPPMAYLEPPPPSQPQPRQQNLARSGVDKASADRARDEYERSQGGGDSRWPLERGAQRPNISPEKNAPPTSEMPSKSPWEDVHSRNRGSPSEAPPYRSPSRSSRPSRASPSPTKDRGHLPDAGSMAAVEPEKTTFITSWSQAETPSPRHSHRQENIPETREGYSRTLSRRLSGHHQHQLPDVVPTTATTNSAASKNLRKRGPSQMRHKSRSPFGDVEIGSNQPAPPTSASSSSSLYASGVGAGRQLPLSDAALPQATSFEQTVPLLAGAVNPVNPLLPPPLLPSSATTTQASIGSGGGTPPFRSTEAADGRSGGELPAASSRPGVKLTIAPRVKVPVLPPGSGLKTKQPGSRQLEPSSLDDDAGVGGDDSGLTDRLLSSRRRGDPVDHESRHSRHQQERLLHRHRGDDSGGSRSATRRSDGGGGGADRDEAVGRSPVRDVAAASRSALSPPLGSRRRLRRQEVDDAEVLSKRSHLGYQAVSPGDLDAQDFRLLTPSMERDERRGGGGGFDSKRIGIREPYQDRGSFDSRDNFAGDGHRRMGDGGSRSRYDDQRGGNRRDLDLERDSYGQSQYRGRGVDRRSDFDAPEPAVGAFSASSSYRHRAPYEDRGGSGGRSAGPSVATAAAAASDGQRRYRSKRDESPSAAVGLMGSGGGYRSYRGREEDASPPPPTEAYAATSGNRRSRATRGARVDRSRSPFESSHNREDAAAAEQRLNELRKRLTVVDDAIAELRAHGGSKTAAAGMR